MLFRLATLAFLHARQARPLNGACGPELHVSSAKLPRSRPGFLGFVRQIAPANAFVATGRALHKYMHGFYAGITPRATIPIPVVQLTQLQKLSNKNFKGTGVLKSSQ
jgi:hypothetical protein